MTVSTSSFQDIEAFPTFDLIEDQLGKLLELVQLNRVWNDNLQIDFNYYVNQLTANIESCFSYEEGVVYQTITDRLGMEYQPIVELQKEHEMIRNHLSEIKIEIKKNILKKKITTQTAFLIRSLLLLLQTHFIKDTLVIYPMARSFTGQTGGCPLKS